MFYWLWLKRVLLAPRNIFQFSTLFSLFSLILGVASLTTAVLAINGFSLGLEKAIVDMSGHVIIHSEENKNQEQVLDDISSYDHLIKNKISFLSSEGLILHSKKFKGLFIEGVEDSELMSSQFLQNRILTGEIKNSKDFLIIGKSLAGELHLDIGSSAPLIISGDAGSYFSRKQKIFKIGAIADFGRYDFNSRYVLMPLSALQSLEKKEKEISGIRLWLKNGDEAEILSQRMNKKLSAKNYTVSSWKDLDRNFFEIINTDKKIIFLVLLILILAAGFNISSSLFIQVFKKTKDISILKSMGGKQTFIRNLFLLNGLVIGLVGIGLGLLMGSGVCYYLIFLQDKWNFIPEEIYQVNKIVLQWKIEDFLFVFISSLVVVLLSSLIPARRAYKLSVKKGLSYD